MKKEIGNRRQATYNLTKDPTIVIRSKSGEGSRRWLFDNFDFAAGNLKDLAAFDALCENNISILVLDDARAWWEIMRERGWGRGTEVKGKTKKKKSKIGNENGTFQNQVPVLSSRMMWFPGNSLSCNLVRWWSIRMIIPCLHEWGKVDGGRENWKRSVAKDEGVRSERRRWERERRRKTRMWPNLFPSPYHPLLERGAPFCELSTYPIAVCGGRLDHSQRLQRCTVHDEKERKSKGEREGKR